MMAPCASLAMSAIFRLVQDKPAVPPTLNHPAERKVLAHRYDAGGGESKAASLLGYDDRSPVSLRDGYLEKLSAAFGKGGYKNPFAGAQDRR